MRSRSLTVLSSLLLTAVFSLPAEADVRIRINQTSQRMSVSVDGQPLYHWPVSTGLPGHRTPNGSFRALRLERVYFSRKYDNAPMPHAVFFTSAGHAIHGTRHVRRLGRAASHGCVRLSPSNAAALFSIIEDEGLGNTRITIIGSEPLVARNRERGFRTASHRRRYDYGTVPAGLQMQMEPAHGYYTRSPFGRSYQQPAYAPYGFNPDDDNFE
ncbi:L,D-transpeptidase [Methylobacterium sp. P31]